MAKARPKIALSRKNRPKRSPTRSVTPKKQPERTMSCICNPLLANVLQEPLNILDSAAFPCVGIWLFALGRPRERQVIETPKPSTATGASATARLRDFSDALRRGDTQAALEAARDACLAEPNRAEAHYAFGQAWIAAGKIKWKETVENGIDKAPDAFLKLFKGENMGKMLVKLG